jgi:hypothetical protein
MAASMKGDNKKDIKGLEDSHESVVLGFYRMM